MDPPNNKSLFCGEHVDFVCTANKTKYIKVSIPDYGLHTFMRNSPKMTSLGPFTLNLTEAEGDSENLLLTSFQVRGFTSEEFILSSVLVTCSDIYSSQTVNFYIKSKFLCISVESCCRTIKLIVVSFLCKLHIIN